MYPERDLNPHDPFGSTDFKSVVSTNSTIRAGMLGCKLSHGFQKECLPSSGNPLGSAPLALQPCQTRMTIADGLFRMIEPIRQIRWQVLASKRTEVAQSMGLAKVA